MHKIHFLEAHLLFRLELLNTPTASLQKGKIPSPTSVLDITLNNLMLSLHFNAMAPRSALAHGPIYGKVELIYVLMLNWIVWNSTIHINKNGFGIK